LPTTSTPVDVTATATTGPAPDRCPRCGGGFHCGAADPGPCACGTVTLSAELQRALRERYDGCLCLTCLVELADTPGAT
jgi:predicted nucleic acid binding AN1-type Zn finger protein